MNGCPKTCGGDDDANLNVLRHDLQEGSVIAVVDMDIFKGLLSTKRVYAACASLKEKSLDDATRAFLNHKLREALREMRETIEYVEEQLGDARAS